MTVISTDSLVAILASLGIEAVDVRGDEVFAHCPGHLERVGKTDASPSWSINAENSMHHCFSCRFSGSLTSLIAKMQGIGIEAAQEFVLDHAEISMIDLVKRLDNPIVEDELVTMSDASLALFCEPPAWALANRQISREDAQHFGVLWSSSGDRWILPLRHPHTGALLGWQEKFEGVRGFRNSPPGLKKSHTAFGICEFVGPTMIVVESPLDAVRLRSLGFEAIATCGAVVSDHQYELFLRADRLILAFDNPFTDEAGRCALKDAFDWSRSAGTDFWAFNYQGLPHKDVGEMTSEHIQNGITHATHSIRGIRSLIPHYRIPA